MKRHILTLFLILAFVATSAAQNGPAVAELFDGRYNNASYATVVYLSGSKVAPYNLTRYRSLTLTLHKQKVAAIEQLLNRDAATATDKEITRSGGQIAYAALQIKRKNKDEVYCVFYRNRPASSGGQKRQITLILTEGRATISELKEKFKQ